MRALPCRVGIKMSAVEVRFENLSIDADVRVGGRALPTVFNTFLNFVEVGALCTGMPSGGTRDSLCAVLLTEVYPHRAFVSGHC